MEESRQMTSVPVRKNCIAFILIICTISGLLLLSGCTGLSGGSEDTVSSRPEVSLAEAKEAAFKAAKVEEKEVIVTRRKIAEQDETPVYNICFNRETKHENVRYDCVVDGITGKVIKISRQVQTQAPANITKDSGKNSDGSKMDLNDFIGVKSAKTAAVFDSGYIPSEVSFKSVKLINRGGRMIYVTEFKAADMDYTFEIDAFNGEVLSREVVYAD